MAWQFPDILGIRTSDPMLSDQGIDSIPTAEGEMLEQAANKTATVTISVGPASQGLDRTLSHGATEAATAAHSSPRRQMGPLTTNPTAAATTVRLPAKPTRCVWPTWSAKRPTTVADRNGFFQLIGFPVENL